MSTALAKAWTVEQFLDWVETQDERYEFDGVEPVDMNGSTAIHNRIAIRLISMLEARLHGTPYQLFALEAGVRVGDSVRYPDALVTGTHQPDTTRIISDVRAVFEVLSPSTTRTDRFTKSREYAAVPSILRYAMIESAFPGVVVLHRAASTDPWTRLTLSRHDTFLLPEAGVQFPVADLYDLASFPPGAGDTA